MQIVQNDLPLQAPGLTNTFNDDMILQTTGVNTSYSMVLTLFSIESEHPLKVLRHENSTAEAKFPKVQDRSIFMFIFPLIIYKF